MGVSTGARFPPVLPRPPISRRLALGLLALFALALGTHLVGAVRARLTLPTGEAEWIWKPLARDESSPVAFYLLRDFTLDPPPAAGRLLVSADEEYILYLNGRRIGSGRYAVGPSGRGTQLDRYEVGPLLAPGGNRLVAEVRSGRGAGGFLLALVDGAGHPLLGTDDRWRVFRRDQPFLLRGLVPLSPDLLLGTGEAVASWGLPPMGRWGRPVPGPARPLYDDLIDGLPPVAVAHPLLPPVPRALFDFGREVTGYLHLDIHPDPVQQAGLLYTATDRVPDLLGVHPDGAVLTLPAQPGWEAACPRRFRYALVVGLAPTGARVQPVGATQAAPLPPGRPVGVHPRGVLGIEPPPLRTPVENEVGRKFQRVPGVAGREEL